jgi:integrase
MRMMNWTKAAGLKPGCTLHGLRKTLGKLLAEEGATTRQIMDILGHKDIAHAELCTREAKQKLLAGPLTVSEAFDRYIPKLQAKNPRTAKDTEGRIRKHFFPKFQSRRVIDLAQTEIGNWHASLVKTSRDDEAARRSKDSANRVLSMVKAFLNDAWQDQKNHITSNDAWRNVKPFKNVARSREVRYSPEQARRLIDCCADKHFADLVTGSYLTGARYGELVGAKIVDLDVRARTLRVSGKTGSRDILLQSSAVEFTNGRVRESFIFVKADGEKWKRSEQSRPMKAAIKMAELDDRGSLYALRHAYRIEDTDNHPTLCG